MEDIMIEKMLDKMVVQEGMTQEEVPTTWISSLTYLCKPNGSLKVHLYPKDLRREIIRENHIDPVFKKIHYTWQD